ncbi:MAG: M43 family zinc metalloprotease [Bacteroidia bacterium]
MRSTSLILLGLCYLLLVQTAAAQSPACGTDAAWDELTQREPAMLERMRSIDRVLAASQLQNRQGARSVLTVPVVVHIIHNNGIENIPDAQVQQAITDLNDAFRNRAPFDPASGSDTQIEFCLAVQDPAGNLTNGINRIVSPLTNMTSPTDDITLKNLSRWSPTEYLNIWLVREIVSLSSGPNVAGYAYFPSAHGGVQDGIVNETRYFGNSPVGSRVHVHEAGHYFGLYHTFQGGCTNTNCAMQGDRVCDTPPDGSTARTACNSGVNSCTTDEDDVNAQNPFRPLPFGIGDQADMISNYMDYGDQTCQTQFTAGQASRMRAALTTTRASLLSSQACQTPCLSAITAGFTTTNDTLVTGITHSLTNTSTNATTFAWKVNGVVFSTLPNPTISFTQSGWETITLVVGNADPNCIDSVEYRIRIVCPFTANFTPRNQEVAPGTTVNFTQTTFPPTTNYTWFLDGVLAQSGTNWNQNFATNGGYNIALVASDGTCSDTVEGFVQVGICDNGKRTHNWFFGNFAGITFNGAGAPTAVTNGALRVDEGCSAISDRYGNLLMYSNGLNVYNRNHQVMPNGAGLLGNQSTTQSGLIIPAPDDDELYYVIALDQLGGPNGASYSIVDMQLDGGLGDVTAVKNVPLISSVTEKMVAVRHSNGTDVWLIVHGWGNDLFYAFLITCGGIQTQSIVSQASPVFAPGTGGLALNNALGQMAASPDGTMLATGHYLSGFVHVYNFDAASGQISNRYSFQGRAEPPNNFISTNGIYGVSFSPNSRYLYTLCGFCGNKYSQFDLQAGGGIVGAVQASQDIITTRQSALQLGPDGRLYSAQSNTSFLHVVPQPNSAGFAGNYLPNAVSLSFRTNRVGGLPGFVTNYFDPNKDEIEGDETICMGTDTAIYSMPKSSCTDSMVWTYRGPGTILWEIDNEISIAFGLPVGRTDTLMVDRYSGCGKTSDTLLIQIARFNGTILDLGPDTAFCTASTITLQNMAGSSGGFFQYLWSTGATTPSITINQPSTYWLEATTQGSCTSRDTIVVDQAISQVAIDLGPDTCMCPDNAWVMQLPPNLGTYTWQDGSDLNSFTAWLPGTYHVTVTDACGATASDTLVLSLCANPPSVDLGLDTLVASVDSLDAGPSGCRYLWSTGDTTRKIPTITAGTYSVSVDCGGCMVIDDIDLYDVILPDVLRYFRLNPTHTKISWAPTDAERWWEYRLDFGTHLNNFKLWESYEGEREAYSEALLPTQRGFFRLQLHDYTGQRQFSQIIEYNPDQVSVVSLFPNPSEGSCNIVGIEIETVQVSIYDMRGRLVWAKSINRSDEGFILNPQFIGEGVYVVKILDQTSGSVHTRKWSKM